MKRRKSGQKPESIDELQQELERLNAEIARARARKVEQVMDRMLKMMKDYSISLADLERHRRKRKKRAGEALRFRDPVTGESWSIARSYGRRTTIAAQTDDGQTEQMSSPDPDSKA